MTKSFKSWLIMTYKVIAIIFFYQILSDKLKMSVLGIPVLDIPYPYAAISISINNNKVTMPWPYRFKNHDSFYDETLGL